MYRIGKEEIEAVARVIEGKDFFKTNNSFCETMNLEKEMREKFGVNNVLVMTSGHAAIASALVGMGIGPGDQVIVPAYTYIATAMAVVEAGAIPVIADIDESLTIDPRDIERKITKYTKAIIPVHIQGFPCDMDAIMAIAEKYNLKVIEDACQADGGSYKGKRLTTIGHAGAMSFNYFKLITAGEGGALLTNDKTVYDRALIYHDSSAVAFFGDQLKDVDSQLFCGTEYRYNDINSAILRCQLRKMDTIISDLHKVKSTLMRELEGTCKFIKSNDIEGDLASTLALLFDTKAEAEDCFNKVTGFNTALPIDTGKHIYTNWTPILNKVGALHPAMDPFKMEANRGVVPDYKLDDCQKSLDILSRVMYVHLHPDMTDADIANIVASIKSALKK